MTTTVQVDQYTLTIPSPDSLNTTKVTYTVNNTTKTVSLSRETLREQTTSTKATIAQTESQLNQAQTNLNQAQDNLNRATAQLNQVIASKPVYNRNTTSYYLFSQQEADYQRRLQQAQDAVNSASKSVDQANTIKTNYQVQLGKQKNELAALEDILSKFNTFQQTSLNTQLAENNQLKKQAQNTLAQGQQAGSVITNKSPAPIAQAPTVGAISDNFYSAESTLSDEEIQRLLSDANAKLEAFEEKIPVTLDQTPAAPQMLNQRISASDNVVGQKNEITEYINQNKTVDAVAAQTSVPEKKPEDNPLHQYVNYTYNFSLFVLTPENYNSLAKNPRKFTLNPDQLLISSGGKRQDFGTNRNPNFTDDFYFESVKIETVAGMSQRGRGTNAYDFQFTIIEPMGFTLFNRLLNLAKDMEIPNYLEMPFLLKLDFFGSTDAGEMLAPISNQTKLIAIKLIECKTQVGVRGTEYQFRAVPFNQQAFSETVASVPANFSVTASTVKEFFDTTSLDKGISTKDLDEAQRDEKDLEIAKKRGDLEDVVAAIEERKANRTYVVSSYAAGINSWLKYLVDLKARTELSEVEFKFDKEFENSLIVRPEKQKVESAAMNGKASATVDPCADKTVTTASAFPINAGTDVLKVIDLVMQNCKFILDQPIDPAADSKDEIKRKKTSPMVWYKVRAQVELKKFDYKANKWAKKITYAVTKCEVPNVKHPYGAAAQTVGSCKKYNYIYTGQNKDILDLKLDFDMTFYLAVSVGRNHAGEIGNSVQQDDPDASAEKFPKQPAHSAQPQYFEARSGNQMATAGGNALNDAKRQIIADIAQNIYSAARGDMINLDLKIVGDPEFIKQDDLYLNPASGFNFDYSQQYVSLSPDGNARTGSYSLNFDSGPILVDVNFKTPVDYSDETGLLRQDGRYTTSVFSGVYQVITVTSEFRQGKFEQILKLVRMFGQEDLRQKESQAQRAQPGQVEQVKVDSAARSYWDTAFDAQDDATGVDAAVLSQNNTVQDDATGVDAAVLSQNNTVQDDATGVDRAVQTNQFGNIATFE